MSDTVVDQEQQGQIQTGSDAADAKKQINKEILCKDTNHLG